MQVFPAAFIAVHFPSFAPLIWTAMERSTEVI
jgi:hypothetical protein